MRIYQLLKPVFTDGYASSDKGIPTMIICLLLAFVLGFAISCIYRLMCRQTFYNSNFNLSLIVLCVITAAIILTIQSNIVVSLGMVGALSIVRFRTAVKDPLDLIFLFWSIGTGIICGAGFVVIAVLLALTVTLAIAVFRRVKRPDSDMMILVVNARSVDDEQTLSDFVRQASSSCSVQAKSATPDGLHMTFEVRLRDPEILKHLLERPEVLSASLVRNDGEVGA